MEIKMYENRPDLMEAYQHGRYDERVEYSKHSEAGFFAADNTIPPVMKIDRVTLKREKLGIAISGLSNIYSVMVRQAMDANFREYKKAARKQSLLAKILNKEPVVEASVVVEDFSAWLQRVAEMLSKELRRANLVADIKINVDTTFGNSTMLLNAKTWIEDNE